LWAGQVKQIRGYADQHLRHPGAPEDPSNRRISVQVQYGEPPAGNSSAPAAGKSTGPPAARHGEMDAGTGGESHAGGKTK
jgi:chemotaxis protein MotB